MDVHKNARLTPAGRADQPLRTPNAGELIHIDIKKLNRFNRTGHRITGDRTGQSNSRGIGEASCDA